jgi:D-arabinose 1-dehydrogenase-like Zn-dependent alcohol dehydrogenase
MRGGGQGITHRLPLVMGVDGAGEVVSAPPGSSLSPGDRVLLYPVAFCGRCPECQRGEQPFCERVRIAGEHRHGTFAELIAMPAAWIATRRAARLLAGDGQKRRQIACRIPLHSEVPLMTLCRTS